MTQQEIMGIAHTIQQQLFGLTPGNVICSWGVTYPLIATQFHEMAALCLIVDARLFKGKVYICYDEGADYYIIYLKSQEGEKLLGSDLDFTQIGDIIDENIEVGRDRAEYDRFCEAERQKLIRGIIG